MSCENRYYESLWFCVLGPIIDILEASSIASQVQEIQTCITSPMYSISINDSLEGYVPELMG